MRQMRMGQKRWLGLLLVIVMLLGGCGMGNPGVGTEKDKNPTMTQAPTGGAVADNKGNTASGNNETTGNETEKDENYVSVRDGDIFEGVFESKLRLFEQLIEEYYMNDVSIEDLQTGIYKGMFAGLGDPYSCYYTAEEFEALMESTSGVYYGIGTTVQQNMKTMIITIVKPFVNGPAYAAGMLPGDIIYKVDGVDVTGMEIDNVVTMMKGPEGTPVEVTVIREGVADPIVLNIIRAKVEVETITWEMLPNDIGLISISGFEEVTFSQFKKAVEQLRADGAKGLIFDLRDNGGGLLDAVVNMLDYLLPQGLIVYTKDREGRTETYTSDASCIEMPMAVLINGNSASASEIFTAALQDYGVAEIVGTTSFGKGIVQQILPLNDGTAVKLTVSRYFTPNGVCIHGAGVTPDVEVELEEALRQQVVIKREDDNQLQAAIKVLLGKMIQ